MIKDKPIGEENSDKLGFTNISRHLARAFLENNLKNGFVVGVEGSWGSGKSSLVNLAIEELKNKKGTVNVVQFTPWLVGSRNELLVQLFSDLEPVIIKSLPVSERDDARNLLKRYAKASSRLASIFELAELGGMPLASQIAKFIKETGREAKSLSEKSLTEMNSELRNKLSKMEVPVVVFVDDLDRLDPDEISEVLRLIKAVADFPNVAYILAYDADVVSASLKKSLGVENGRRYLEKIVQASFKVPSAMIYDLRNWLRDEFQKIHEDKSITELEQSRLEAAYYNWSGVFLKTPRDVVLVLNSLRLNYTPVRGFVDPADMLFLQMVKVKNNRLFLWIENYVSDLASIFEGGAISHETSQRSANDLIEIINEIGSERTAVLRSISEHLPGINAGVLGSSNSNIQVHKVDKKNLESIAKLKGLGSPYHFSYYFSFSSPSGTLSDDEVNMFINRCEKSPDEASDQFLTLVSNKRPQGGRLAEVLLQRIVDNKESITENQVNGIFSVLGSNIDKLVPVARSDFGNSDFLRGSSGQIFGILESVNSAKSRYSIISRLFKEAKSIDWLTGIIREATFDHDDKFKSKESRSRKVLSEKEFLVAKEIYLNRISAMSSSDFYKLNYLLSALYAWQQLGDVNGVSDFIKNNSLSDEEFINLLERMTSWRNSSVDGVSYKLGKETLESFFGGVNPVRYRLAGISKNKDHDMILQGRAEKLFYSID